MAYESASLTGGSRLGGYLSRQRVSNKHEAVELAKDAARAPGRMLLWVVPWHISSGEATSCQVILQLMPNGAPVSLQQQTRGSSLRETAAVHQEDKEQASAQHSFLSERWPVPTSAAGLQTATSCTAGYMAAPLKRQSGGGRTHKGQPSWAALHCTTAS